jgi:hypothetical protein
MGERAAEPARETRIFAAHKQIWRHIEVCFSADFTSQEELVKRSQEL